MRSTSSAVRQFVVRLPQRSSSERVTFSAYAFNADRVKSATAYRWYEPPRPMASVRGKAYFVLIGVSRTESEKLRLLSPERDVRLTREMIESLPLFSDHYRAVVPISLVSGDHDQEGDLLPTKDNIRTILDLLAGRPVDDAKANKIPAAIRRDLESARPEDLVVIVYSGHGESDPEDGSFYLYPFDVGTQLPVPTTRRLDVEELASWLRAVDAGEIVLILDACYSSSAAGRAFKPAPLGDRNLGQLAYEKGMRILAASTAEALGLQYGFLVEGLMRDGLKAEAVVGTGQVHLSRWLRFGQRRVAGLFAELQEDIRASYVPPEPALYDFARNPSGFQDEIERPDVPPAAHQN